MSKNIKLNTYITSDKSQFTSKPISILFLIEDYIMQALISKNNLINEAIYPESVFIYEATMLHASNIELKHELSC